MQNRITIIAILAWLCFTVGCSRSGPASGQNELKYKSIIINGVLHGGQGRQVVLEELGAREYIPLDTVICDASGAFEISLSPDDVAFYVLRYGASGYVTLLLDPGEVVDLTGEYDNMDSCEIDGSKGSELLLELSFEHKRTLAELGEITKKSMEMVTEPRYARIKSTLDRKFDSITGAFHEYSLRYIHEHSGSLVILVALYNLYGQGLPVFDPLEDMPIYRYVDSVLMLKYPDFEAVQLLHSQVLQATAALEVRENTLRLQKGEIAPDFVSSRTDGSQMALSELNGNYVLLSFWAGWSRLSRDENPTLKRAMEKYGEHNFSILQVSFDDKRDVWIGAIGEEGLDWDHVCDLMRWDSPVADLYRVEKIPSNYLIDPAGRIIESDLFGEQLLDKLETIFNR